MEPWGRPFDHDEEGWWRRLESRHAPSWTSAASVPVNDGRREHADAMSGRARVGWLVAALAIVSLSLLGFLMWRAGGAEHGAPGPQVGNDGAASVDDGSVGRADRDAEGPAEDITGDSQRVGAIQDAISGVVLDAEGRGIGGAEVAWIPLDGILLDAGYVWEAVDWPHLEARSRRAITDASGRFAFETQPDFTGDALSVLWAVVTGGQPACQLLEAPPAKGSTFVLVVERGRQLAVRVVDEQGSGVEGANVEQIGIRPEGARREDPLWVAAHRALRIVAGTRPDGAVDRPLTAIEGSYLLRAFREGAVSEPWFSALGGEESEIVLRLGPAFIVRGTVRPAAIGLHLELGRQHVEVWRLVDGSWRILGQARVREDGTWGPERVPLTGSPSYRLAVHGGGIAEEVVILDAPRAGAQVVVDFEVHPGIALHVRVQDGEGKPIPRARVDVRAGAGSETTDLVGWTSEDGTAQIEGLRPGIVTVGASAEGFGKAWVEYAGIAPENKEPLIITLEAGARLAGVVLHAGKPLREFAVVWWDEGLHAGQGSQTLAFKDREDGSFELADLPRKTIRLLATSPIHPRSETVAVELSDPDEHDVILEVPAPLNGSGQVVDAETGMPLQSAVIQLFANSGHHYVASWGAPVTTRADGSFDLMGFAPGENRFTIDAPGFARLLGKAFGFPPHPLALGRIPLFRARDALIVLLADGEVDFAAYSALAVGDRFHPARPFSTEGVLALEACSPGRTKLEILHPDGGLQRQMLDFVAGDEWIFEIPVRTGAELAVVLEDSVPDSIEGWSVEVSWKALPNERTASFRYLPLGADRTARASGLAPGPVVVTVQDASGRVRGSAAAELEPGGSTVTVPLEAGSHTFLVVDERDHPVHEAEVHITRPDGEGGWYQFGFTDEDGRCTFEGLPFEEVAVGVIHPALGQQFGEIVDVGSGSVPTLLRLGAREELELRLMAGTVPAEGIRVLIDDITGTYIVADLSSGPEGLVRVPAVGKGSYQLRTAHPGIWPRTVQIRTGLRAADQMVRIYPMGALEARASTSGNQPLPGVEIELVHVELGGSLRDWLDQGMVAVQGGGTATDQMGMLVIEGIPAGTYRWRAILQASPVEEGEILVQGGSRTVLVIDGH